MSARIVLITGNFPVYEHGYKTGETEFVASHGINTETLENVVVPWEHPRKLGAKFEDDEWYLN